MLKTSVYLDEACKADLERAAELTGRAQADLIRDGIEQVIAQHLRVRPPMKAHATGPTLLDRADHLMESFGR
ncbi:MAG: hypothetical protein LBI33_09370 [Propionibacteriaceae bacterium]|jgi:hypothetical protein|nr:hypothetical protein [Propionibacteriaceae bacterium]